MSRTDPELIRESLSGLPQGSTGNNGFAVSIAMLLLRLSLGWTFIYHGSQLAFGAFEGPGLSTFSQGLTHLPLLPPIVWGILAAYSEFGCGLLVFIGLLTRLATLPLIMTMMVAIVTVHGPNGFSILHNGYEYNLALIAVAATLLLVGPGLVSVDAFLFRQGFWSIGPQPLAGAVRRESGI